MPQEYTPASGDFAEALATDLPEGRLRPVEARYLEERRGRLTGSGGTLALPRSAEEVALILSRAHEARVAVVPYGGGTGLVGGGIGPGDPLILSLEKMDGVRSVYPTENVLVAEAGAILADVQAAAVAEGRLFGLSLASEGSARIGGLLATNAGGLNVLRYGTARAQCLGLEVVTADGRIWHGLTRLWKDNTGYDLRDLFIGSEGTLGIITAAALKLAPRPAASGTALLSVPSPEAALELLGRLRARVGEGVSGFELISRAGWDFLTETGMAGQQPLDPMPDWMVLIELGLSEGQEPAAALEALFAEAAEAGLSDDGVIAQSAAQADALWSLRETIPEANRAIGAIASHDIALPLSAIPEFHRQGLEAMEAIAPLRVNAFGHLGDGNLHWNVFPPKGEDRGAYDGVRAQVTRAVHDLVAALGGSISAEHGIGRFKVDDLERYADPVKLALMRSVKDALDPRGILNPGAVLRAR
ncbi:FAD-binding oxidoreductase [Pseudoroseicyclus aestuarii]|uniref:FAD/FMN-containing dehydrogenase n=1 Tax=Pseudoroseicyclus aestuarii TaxID=1795041 RepID=A0A318STM9_9RHOB|nr:FAD-binding oxidoreductase [Pseudoroseicyclus aestuarii]PYE85003.1 FAD/FMN-containing dehydrogenase [Pseudoroseicyclus aestuarii]